MRDLTYCEKCLGNFSDDAFDYRFNYPVCFSCVDAHKLKPVVQE